MGNLKCLILTSEDAVVDYRDRRIFLKNGRVVPLRKLRSIVSFYECKKLSNIFNIPFIYISEDKVILRNVHYNGYSNNFSYMALDKLVDYALNIFRKIVKDVDVKNCEYFIEWLYIQKLLANAFFGVIAGIYFNHGMFLADPYADIKIGSRTLKLWQVLILPAVSYGVAKEFNNIWLYGVEKYSDAESCLNAVLSYIFGSPHFSFVLRKSMNIGAFGGICQLDHAETHGSFPSYTCKF